MIEQLLNIWVLGLFAGAISIGFLLLILWYRRRVALGSLGNQLLLAFTGVSAISVTLVVGAVIWQTRAILTAQTGVTFISLAESNSQRFVEGLVREVELLKNLARGESFFYLIFGSVETDLSRLAANERDDLLERREAAWGTQNDVTLHAQILSNPATSDLKGFISDFPAHTQLVFVDQYGALVATAGLPAKHYYYGDQIWWQKAWNNGAGDIYIGGLQFTPGEQDATIEIAVPVRVPGTEEVRGVLRSRFMIRNLSVFANPPSLGESGRLTVIDKAGVIIYSFNPSQIGTQITGPFLTDITKYATSWGVDPDETGQDVIHSHSTLRSPPEYAYLDDLGWAFTVQQSTSEALATVGRLSLLALIGGLVALVLATVVGGLVARQITRPIQALTNTTSAMAEGQIERKADVSGPTEFRILAESFNSMTERLRNLIDTLEDRIRERTRALEITTAISHQITAFLNIDELLYDVVQRVQTGFNYYYVHIYLIDQRSGDLVMAEGSGEIGRQLKARGHRLQVGQGIVGTVASTNEPFFSNNVSEIPNFVRNPLLTNTNAELAVPLRKGKQVLGVLDIHSEQINRFASADISRMQSIANQLAVAIDNARLLAETQIALEEVQRLNRRLTREVWYETADKIDTPGFMFTKSGARPASRDWLPTMAQAIQRRGLVHRGGAGNGSDSNEQVDSVAIPLILRGEVIGVVGIERPAKRPWSEDELIAIQTITEQITLALESARLTRQTERAAWRDRVVSESTAKVWSSSEIEEVMKAAVAQLGDKLRASEVVIQLGTEGE